jgi:hypothetical protein
MSAISPILIALAVVLPQIVLMAGLYLWVSRNRQPDVARIKVFRGLLWFILFIFLALLAALIVLGPNSTHSTEDFLLPFGPLFLLAVLCVYQIQLCQRRLRNK